MNTTDTVKLAEFLARDYPFDIRVTEGACPVCFRHGEVHIKKSVRDSKLDSPTSKFEARRKRFELWMELFDNGVDPMQCINAYIPAFQRAAKVPKFPQPLIILSKLGKPCKNNPNCFSRCLLCDGEMGQLPSITLAPWNFPVHECCTDPCGFTAPGAARGVCCETRVLTIPKFFKDTLNITIRCAKHGGQGGSEAKKPAMEVIPSKEIQPAKTAPPLIENPARSLTPRPKPPQRKPLKIERVKEKGCHDIAQMLFPDRKPTAAAKPEPKRPKIAFPRDDPTSSKGPGAQFFYGAKHFDFTEPKRLFPSGSDDLAHEKDEDEAGPSASNGEDRGPS